MVLQIYANQQKYEPYGGRVKSFPFAPTNTLLSKYHSLINPGFDIAITFMKSTITHYSIIKELALILDRRTVNFDPHLNTSTNN